MKTTSILMAVGLSLAAEASANQTWREQSQRAIAPGGLSVVAVENGRGRIEARKSPDGQIHITALKIARAPRLADAKSVARETAVELLREDSRYLVRVHYPRGRSTRVNVWDGLESIGLPRIEVRLTILVPDGMNLELAASSGDLYSQGIAGSQTLRASSGDVWVEGARGALQINTSSGDVSIRDVKAARIRSTSGDVEVLGGPVILGITTSSGDVSVARASDSLRVETGSGDVSVDRAGRDATLRTSSGEVQVRGASGRVSISSGSGDVVAAILAPLTEASVTTASGDIRLGLDSRVGCQLEMRTSSGSLDVDVPLRPSTLTRRAVSGSVRGGTAPVSLRTSSGSIAVVSGEP